MTEWYGSPYDVYDDQGIYAMQRMTKAKDSFFRRLLDANATVQQQLLKIMTNEIHHMLTSVRKEENMVTLTSYYPTIVRLAREAPFPEMRTTFMSAARKIQAKCGLSKKLLEYKPRVSLYIPNEKLACGNMEINCNPSILQLFQNIFLRTGRVSHFHQILAWHPTFLALHQECVSAIMWRGGTLPLAWRSYIALMAVSEFRCSYWADLLQNQFIVAEGDIHWLRGIEDVSPKLHSLHVLSSLLAHRPWLINQTHIADLLSRHQNDDNWSVSELVHAIIVLCQYHSMASIALGLGCTQEEDFVALSDLDDLDFEVYESNQVTHDNYSRRGSISSYRSRELSLSESELQKMDVDEQALMERLKLRFDSTESLNNNRRGSGSHIGVGSTLKHSSIRRRSDEDDGEGAPTEDEDEDGNIGHGVYYHGEDEAEEDDEQVFAYVDDRVESGSNRDSITGPSSQNLWRFIGGTFIKYTDFDIHSPEYSILHTEDFCWGEHGFSLVKRYFPGETGQVLEDLFKLTGRLTYEYFGQNQDTQVDTTPYRDAIWYYVHRIYGICHDDYDYRLVNTYLNRPTKVFIKRVACTPWKVQKKDFDHFNHSLSPSEKCHVTLIVAEARKQAGLLYGLRAVMKYMR